MAMQVLSFKHLVFSCIALVFVGCAPSDAVQKKPEPVGDFKLGITVVVANQVKKGPLSRTATQEMLVNAVKPEIVNLLGQLDGEKFYNVGVSIDAYVLAVPGIPIVASPKSTLILGLTIWDDSTQTKLIDPPEQIIILEKFSTKSIFGSGLTQTKEEQLALLSQAVAQRIYNWMVENKALFEPKALIEPEES